jgi:hypothetical protein
MTEHKFTDEEVIKALGNAIETGDAPIGVHWACTISKQTAKDALDLIKRQKAEIKSLEDAGKGVVYGETKFWHAKDGEVVEYTCIGYCEQLVWVHEDRGYRLARLIYGRNFKHASTAFMFSEHPTFLHTPTVGREVFFDKEEALAAAKAQRDAANLI